MADQLTINSRARRIMHMAAADAAKDGLACEPWIRLDERGFWEKLVRDLLGRSRPTGATENELDQAIVAWILCEATYAMVRAECVEHARGGA